MAPLKPPLPLYSEQKYLLLLQTCVNPYSEFFGQEAKDPETLSPDPIIGDSGIKEKAELRLKEEKATKKKKKKTESICSSHEK